MLTSILTASLISLSASAPMHLAADERREPTVKLIDARDLVSVLPPARGGNPMAPVMDLVMGMGRSLELRTEPLADGVFAVTGEEEPQSRFIALLEQVRDLYRGQYEVELACYAATSPAEIGSPAKIDSASIRVRQAVSRRQECRVEASRTILYIAKWQPVVADNSVGYDAQTERASAGLMVTILVGAGPDAPDGSIDMRVRGEISDVQLREFSVPLMGEGKGGLPIQLPTTNLRSINADSRIGAQPRVIGVVPGFKEGEVLIIAASARPVAGKE
ncbi:MAG: hypothetical protein IT436_16645 [Phycisphaerales bacterium]|nr:hypothetical protein [Phycisphaerales bacterium]